MSSANPPRALLAVRISNLTEVTTSPDSQLARVKAEAERQGARVVGVADDLDVSAAKVEPWDRPKLGPWLQHPEEYDMIICRDLYRVIRSMADFSHFYEWTKKNEVRLITLDPYVDYYSQVGQVVGYMLAWVGEMEVQNDSARVQGALEHMRSIGRWGNGRVPYGYRMAPHPSGTGYGLEPNPETSEIILEAARRVMNGDSILSIVRHFNETGVLPPDAYNNRKRRGKQEGRNGKRVWHPQSLTVILRSPSMRNLVTHDGRIVRDADGAALHYGPPLMDDDTHRQLVAVLDRRASPKGRRRSDPTPLLGVIVCAECGHDLYQNSYPVADGTRTVVYRCTSSYRGLSKCAGCSVDAEAAEKFAEREFLRRVGRMPVVIFEDDPGESHDHEIADLEDALTELEKDRYEGGLFRGEEGRARYRQQYQRIEKRLEGLRALPSRPPGVREIETGMTYAHEWEVSSVEDRRHLLMDRGARLFVTGRDKDGPPEDRMRFEFRGSTDEELIEQGHDDPFLGE